MKQIILLATALLMAGSAFADWGYYQLPITRDGKTKTMLAYNNWSGEYPGPVIDVPKNMTVVGYKSLRKLTEKKSCNIKKGLYHPWGKSPSAYNLYTISDVLRYTATQKVEMEEMFVYENGNSIEVGSIDKGDVITNVIYLSEGWCSAGLNRVDQDSVKVEFFCDYSLDKEGMKNNNPGASLNNYEQWVHLKCENGGSVFVQDKDFLSQPGVREGQITGYGSIAPAK